MNGQEASQLLMNLHNLGISVSQNQIEEVTLSLCQLVSDSSLRNVGGLSIILLVWLETGILLTA